MSGAPETSGPSPIIRDCPLLMLLSLAPAQGCHAEALQMEGGWGQRPLRLSLQRWDGRPGRDRSEEGCASLHHQTVQEDASRLQSRLGKRVLSLTLCPVGTASRWTPCVLLPAKQQRVTLLSAKFKEDSAWLYQHYSKCNRMISKAICLVLHQ